MRVCARIVTLPRLKSYGLFSQLAKVSTTSSTIFLSYCSYTHKKNLCNIIILLNFMYVALFIHDSLLKLLNIRFKSFWESLEIWLNTLLLFHAVILLDAQSEVIYLAILLWKYISYFPILYWFYKCGVPKGSCLILSNKRIMVTVSESNAKDSFLQSYRILKLLFSVLGGSGVT